MKRAELFAAIAAVLPIGALALVPEEPRVEATPEMAKMVPLPEDDTKLRWMIVHARSDNKLASYHLYGEGDCPQCKYGGVPAPVWYSTSPASLRWRGGR